MIKLSKYYTMMYKLAEDFENIENDVMNQVDGICKNYVVNYGLQNSYEVFMTNKQKFIEELMTLDMFTNTIKEIINYIEHKVDMIIDETSPDLKSSCSNSQSMSIFQ